MKTALITGGTKGIGKALVEVFASQGYNIITCSRDLEALTVLQSKIQSEFGVQLDFQRTDLSQKDEVLSFIDFVQKKASIDVLINNAGLFKPATLLEEEDEDYYNVMSINVDAVYLISKKLLSLLKQSDKPHLFNICSVASSTILPNCGSYTVSKYALLGMTRVLRYELLNTKVKVTAVMPGATYTSSWEGSGVDQARLMNAKEVAKSVWDCYSLSDNAVVEEILIRPQHGDSLK